MNRGAWWATVHGVAKSWTWLSMHTHIIYNNFLSKNLFKKQRRLNQWAKHTSQKLRTTIQRTEKQRKNKYINQWNKANAIKKTHSHQYQQWEQCWSGVTDSSWPARDLLELHPKVLGPRGFLGLKPSALGARKVALPQNHRLQKDSKDVRDNFGQQIWKLT